MPYTNRLYRQHTLLEFEMLWEQEGLKTDKAFQSQVVNKNQALPTQDYDETLIN